MIENFLALPESKKVVRRNFLLNCILLTIISALIAVGSSKYLFKYELPQDNFVTLEITTYIEVDCLELMLETEIEPDEFFECENGTFEIYRTRASGAVISTVENKSWILTADHFCDVRSNLGNIPEELYSQIEVERKIMRDGKTYSFETVSQNTADDLCLVTSEDYRVSKPLVLARSMPEIGELTSTISSPLGITEKGVSLHFSGTFSGCNFNACFFTIPAISGSSGSLVLNYDKEVVGMTQRSLVGFPEVTIGAGIQDITEFILEYEKESGKKIIPDRFPGLFFF